MSPAGGAGAGGRGAGGRGAGPSQSAESKPRTGFRGTAENAKTRICQRWEAGHCRFGDRCNFAHGEDELRQLPPRNPSGGGRGARGRGPEGGYREEGGGGGRGAGRGQGGFGRGGGAAANGRTRDDAAWKAAGCPVPGPQGWTQYRTEAGEAYYHNAKSGETTWDAPECWKHAPKTN